MIVKRAAIGFLVASFVLVAASFPAMAGGLTVYGGKMESNITAGLQFSRDMTVENTSDAPMNLAVDIRGYGMSSGNDFLVLEPEDDVSPYTARQMIAASPSSFRLNPGASQQLSIHTTAPVSGGEGSRYAIVFIHTDAQGQGGVSTIRGFAARVLLTYEGSRLSQESAITSLKWVPESSTPLQVTIRNAGNNHYKPKISAQLSSNGSVIANANIVSEWPIIPTYEQEYKFNFGSAQTLGEGTYEVAVKVADESGAVVAERSQNITVGQLNKPVVITPSASSLSPAAVPASTPELSVSLSEPASQHETTNWTMIAGAIAAVGVVGSGLYLLGIKKGRKVH